jgi:hypothetical protein
MNMNINMNIYDVGFFVIQGLYDITLKTIKFCVAMYVFVHVYCLYTYKNSHTEIGKITSKISRNSFFIFAL